MTTFLTRAFAVVLLTFTFAAVSAHAGPFEDAVAQLSTDSFSDTEAAIAALTTSGNPQAYAIISALQDGRLLGDSASKSVIIKQPDGKFSDAATGAPVASAPAGASAVRLNNRLRRIVEAALGSLTLLSPDPVRRVQAAQSVFKSHDPVALPVIDGALAKETNAAAKRAFTEARAAILLFKPDATETEKLEAIATVKAKGDRDALALLTGLTGDQPPAVVSAAAGATSAIQRTLTLWSYAQNAWYGLSLGSVLLLAAIGLAITFGVMGVINMAHGEMVMIGAYVTFVVQDIIRTSYPEPVRYVAADRGAAGFHRRGPDRHRDRAQHHPFSVRASARNPAGDLGLVARAAAGCPHRVRPDQSRGRQSFLDVRRVRTRPDDDHL